MIPGEIFVKEGTIVCNEGRDTVKINVINTGDRPIQVGSHFHFFEVNKAMLFDREAAFGKRLNIISSTAIRFEPGEEKEVELLLKCVSDVCLIGFPNAGKSTLMAAVRFYKFS